MNKILILGLVFIFCIGLASAYDDWQTGVTYQIDDIVTYQGTDYICIQSHTSQAGWTPPVVPALWNVYINDFVNGSDWVAGYGYSVDDIVLFDNVYYRVIQTHTSQSDWYPSIVPALFEPLLSYDNNKPVIGKNNVTIKYQDTFTTTFNEVNNGLDVEHKRNKVNIKVNSKSYPNLNKSATIDVKGAEFIDEPRIYRITYENVTEEIPIYETIGNETSIIGYENITYEKRNRDFIGYPSELNDVYTFNVNHFSEYELTDGLVSYWKFDETTGTTADDAHSTNDGTVSGATWTTGKINNALSYDGTNDYVNLPTTDTFGSFSLWFNSDVNIISETNFLYLGDLDTSNSSKYVILGHVTSQILDEAVYLQIASSTSYYWTFADLGLTDRFSSSTWYYLVIVWDSTNSNYRIYLNGIDRGLATKQGSPSQITNFNNFEIGASTQNSGYFNGKIDEVAIYDRALTTDEVTALYASGDGFQYPFITLSLNTPQIEGNTITINDTLYYNGTINISSEYEGFTNISCEYTLNNGTNWLSADNNSTHCYKNSLEPTGNLTIQFRAQEDGVGDYTISSLLNADYFENSIITFDAYDIYDNEITTFNVTIDGTTKTNNEEWNLNEGTYTATFSKTDWFNSTLEFNVTQFDIVTQNFTVYPYTKIYAKNNLTDTNLNNFTLTYSGDTYSTTDSLIYIPLYNETSQIDLISTDESLLYTLYSINLTADPYLENYTFNLYPNPSVLDINIYNIDGESITTNITVQLISENYTTNSITNTGNAYFENLTPNIYNVRFLSENYTTADYQQLITFNAYTELNVYLFDNAEYFVTFTTKDQSSGTPIEGATYSISTIVNNSLKTIGSKYSDLSGQAIFNYETDRIYTFTVSKSGFTSKSFQLGPTLNSAYTVWLSEITQYNLTEAFTGVGISYLINPYLGSNNINLISSRFKDNTTNNFTMAFTSPEGELLSYGYNLTYGETTVLRSGSNSYGGTLESTLDINNANILDKVYLNYYFTSSLTGYHELNQVFTISGEGATGLISKLRSEHFGLGIMERVLIVIIIAGIFGGLFTVFNGYLPGALSIMFIFGYFIYNGFLEVWFLALPLVLLFMYIVRGGE